MKQLHDIQQSITSGKETLPERVEHYIEQIDQKNDHLNVFLRDHRDQALADAKTVQAKIENGTAGKLAGSVVGIKDVLCHRGQITSCGSKMLEQFESVYSATAVERLLAEDAIIIGRTNMDEFAMGSSTENSAFGPTKNPVNPDYVPGGSSGGSAAAVAADMCDFTLGSDTGGSIRQPASYCGVVGLKPSYGRVSRHGLVAYASSFDSIGPFTHTVEDAARVLGVIAGHDPYDQTSSAYTVPNYAEQLKESRKLTIGVPKEYFGEGLDPEVRSSIEEQLKALEKEGHKLREVALPHTDYAISTYYILATAEASSNLARYDGVRFGHRASIKDVEEQLKTEKIALEQRAESAVGNEKNSLLAEMGKLDSALIRLYKLSRTEGFGTEVKRRILLGTYVLSSGYYDAYFAKAQKVRRLIKQDFVQLFEDVDVIVSPTAPTTAFKQGENLDDPVKMYLNDIYTISANLAGICGISVPAGTHSNGLPIGIQFMADAFREENILAAGQAVERLATQAV
ncbi:MAG: amidase family protein [Balneolaceae bacterium]